MGETMRTTLGMDALKGITGRLTEANRQFDKRLHIERPRRQPVHVVYGGAHRFKADTARRMGELAVKSLSEYAPDFIRFAQALELRGADMLPTDHETREALLKLAREDAKVLERAYPAAAFAHRVYQRVRTKLEQEPVEDYRIDFEDGFGFRTDEEEDAVAVASAAELAEAILEASMPTYIGIRIKSLVEETRDRSLRTLDLFLTALLEATGGAIPGRFVVTLPKVQHADQVIALVEVIKLLEVKLGLPLRSILVELMIEHPCALFDMQGRAVLPHILEPARGRCTSIHFGAYDYLSSLGVVASEQSLHHPACVLARQHMQIFSAASGVWVSDGATTLLPLPKHKGEVFSAEQATENRASMYRGWRASYRDVRESLKQGVYQGWDLHPNQLPSRFGAVIAFYAEGLESATNRLKQFLKEATTATRTGSKFDDAATAQGLLNFFLRGFASGALSEDEVRATGLSMEEFKSRSFLNIARVRRGSSSTLVATRE